MFGDQFQKIRVKKKKVTTTGKSSHKHNQLKKNENESVETTATSKSIIKHHCKLCGAGFAQFNNFSRHLKSHNDYEMYFDNCSFKLFTWY